MSRGHMDQQFSAAYDGDLSARDHDAFTEHLARCAQCRDHFEAFRAAVDGVRALPHASMPRPVLIPARAASSAGLGASWLSRLRLPRTMPFAATAVAAVVAVALITFVNHSQQQHASPSGAGAALSRPLATGAAAPFCPAGISGLAGEPPVAYAHRVTATTPGRPGQELILATESGTVAAGSSIPVYAVLSLPLPAAAAPGGAAPAQRALALPCVRAGGVADARVSLAAGTKAVAGAIGAPEPGFELAGGSAPAELTVPAGAAPGTVIRVTATVPADYPQAGDPPMNAELLLTVR